VNKVEGNRKVYRRLNLRGLIQGVGFRPFIYRLAQEHNICGWVRNTAVGVEAQLEGAPSAVDEFVHHLRNGLPPGAWLLELRLEQSERELAGDFRILESSEERTNRGSVVPPDVATCPDCLDEFRNPQDRRHRYPFISCTFCGPRFTIITALPYDRPATTFSAFPLCPDCAREYADPADRRFHAQTTACPVCGPRLALITPCSTMWGEEALQSAQRLLLDGGVIAVKGLGGYCLAGDAKNDTAVSRIKIWKNRGDKPLAVMVADLTRAEQIVALEEGERELLFSPLSPILLATKREPALLSEEVAPRLSRHGVMLPSTAMHHLLMEGNYLALVMTSANRKGEPIIIDDNSALALLDEGIDAVLCHDRPIYRRADDTVATFFQGKPLLLRSGRGCAPLTIPWPRNLPSVMAYGSDIKNTFCVSGEGLAYLSQHIGDLESAVTLDFYQQQRDELLRLYSLTPQAAAADLHPGYYSSRLASEEWPASNLITVQHHHAHIASVLAERGRFGGVFLGVACDGTGFGEDGAIWGGEILEVDVEKGGYRRLAHLDYLPLLGGEGAIREPFRQACAYLWASSLERTKSVVRFFETIPGDQLLVLRAMFDRREHSPLTSSCGRIFEALGAFLGLARVNDYDAQSAILLEAVAREVNVDAYPVELINNDQGPVRLDWRGIISGVVKDLTGRKPLSEIAYRIHYSLALLFAMGVEAKFDARRHSGVALSGGCFQNKLFLKLLLKELSQLGCEVLIHQRVPPNDGGLALGQALVAGFRVVGANNH
jgi:hydrogenase maturation protein HypF